MTESSDVGTINAQLHVIGEFVVMSSLQCLEQCFLRELFQNSFTYFSCTGTCAPCPLMISISCSYGMTHFEVSIHWCVLLIELIQFVAEYTKQTKGTKTNTGLYTSLPILHHPWIDICMDFILALPQTRQSHDSVMVVVNRFSKMAHLLPCRRTYVASHVVDLFFKEIICLMVFINPLCSTRMLNLSANSGKHFGQSLASSSPPQVRFTLGLMGK